MRDGAGNYQLPPGNPVTPGTTIAASQFNLTMNDIAGALTDSLPRNGEASMYGPFRLADGTVTVPAFGFNSESNTGLFRPNSNVLGITIGGSEKARFTGGNFLLGTVSDGGQRLQVNGTSAFNGALSIIGNTTITGNTSVIGTTSLSGATTVTGPLTVTGDVAFNGNASLQAALDAIYTARRGTMSALGYDGAVPDGALLANGQAVSRTTYAALFARIGTVHGAGDGSTTFNVPDWRGAVPRGTDEGRGLDPGRTFGSYQADAYMLHGHGFVDPGHTHTVSDPGHGHSAWTDAQGVHSHYVNDPGHAHGSGAPANQWGLRNESWAIFWINQAGQGRGNSTDGATTGIWLNSDGNHAHNVGVGGSGTGISLVTRQTGASITGSGGTETRMKNVATRWVIWY